MKVIVHDKGISRIIPDSKIEKGKWYFGFVCSKCGEKIIALENPTQQTTPFSVVGAGKFSIPCRSCKTDEIIFGTGDLIAIQADKDEVTSNRFNRRKPSNSPRQPASRRYPKAKPTFGTRFVEDRPECAIIIARCVTSWSYVEQATALLLASILKINTAPALAMFLAIQNSATQAAVIGAAAEVVLSPEDYRLFRAMMAVSKAIGDQRNDLVHGLFGGSLAVEEGILWTQKKDQTAHTATVWASDYKTMKTDYLNEVYVYEPADLETIASSIEWLHDFIGFFRGYISSDNATWRAERFPQLCAEPRIAAELARPRKNNL